MLLTETWWHNSSSMTTHSIEAQYFAVLLFCHQPRSTLELLSFVVQRRHRWGGKLPSALPSSKLCGAAELYRRAKSIKDNTQTSRLTLSEIHKHALWTSSFLYDRLLSPSLKIAIFFASFQSLKSPTLAQHLMPFSWHQEPLKDSSGLWNQPAVHGVQRFNKFQGSSQGTATLWTATQNQKPFKYLRRLIIDSLTLSGGILSSTTRKWAVCTYLFIALYTRHKLIMKKKKTLLQFPQIWSYLCNIFCTVVSILIVD